MKRGFVLLFVACLFLSATRVLAEDVTTTQDSKDVKAAAAVATGEEMFTAAEVEARVAAAVEAAVSDAVAAAKSQVGPARNKMPRERESITHKFSLGGHEGYITAGMYEDGTAGEIFLTDIGKEGSTLRGMMNSFATAISIALQYGVPLETLVGSSPTCGSSQRATPPTPRSRSRSRRPTTSCAGSRRASWTRTRRRSSASSRRRWAGEEERPRIPHDRATTAAARGRPTAAPRLSLADGQRPGLDVAGPARGPGALSRGPDLGDDEHPAGRPSRG